LLITGDAFRVEFNRWSGYLTKYEVNGQDLINDGEALSPNFWRAPIDNDFGTRLQQKYSPWKKPLIRLTSLNHRAENGQIIVETAYEMKDLSARLSLTYTVNNVGAVKITQKMTVDREAEVANMFRFGMQMQMPETFEYIEYYGRGPIENYIDRNHCTQLGIYREQYYPYIRPQETGNKTDIRWWRIKNDAGSGLEVIAVAPFSASALHYTIESLDDGFMKQQRHYYDVEKAALTNFCIDKIQAGLGCEDS
jgi:beta-galactosidase